MRSRERSRGTGTMISPLKIMVVKARLQDAAQRPGERNTIRILQVVDDLTECVREE
jgi:hypothetical protein